MIETIFNQLLHIMNTQRVEQPVNYIGVRCSPKAGFPRISRFNSLSLAVDSCFWPLYEIHGRDQVHLWRRSFDIRPPVLAEDDERHPHYDPRYAHLKKDEIPSTESLKDALQRVMFCWHEVIKPELKAGKRILICAHGNSLRALVKYLDDISDEDISGFEIPTGNPLVYELDNKLKPLCHYYLAEQENK